MARKIIRASDREKAREESKKAAEALPVKPAEPEVDKTKLAFPKPGKIKSVSDLDGLPLSFSALQGAVIKGSGIPASWYSNKHVTQEWNAKPQPPDFTLDRMLEFTGCAVPGEGDKYRTDGVIVGHGFIYATDLKCSLRVSDLCIADFDLYLQVNGDVSRGDSALAPVVGYMSGKAGCNGADLETPPMHKMPWVAVGESNWSIIPLASYNTQPIIRTHKCPCPACVGGFTDVCPVCKGVGCKSCKSNGGTKCVFCTDGTLNTIVGYRYITPNKPGEFILSLEYHNKIQSLPDVGVYPAKVKGILGFDFRVNKDQRGKGICVTMDEPKYPGEYVSAKEVQSKMLKGSGGSVGKTNTMASQFAQKLFEKNTESKAEASAKTGVTVDKMADSIGYYQQKAAEMEQAMMQQQSAAQKNYELTKALGPYVDDAADVAETVKKMFPATPDGFFGPSTIMGGNANKPKPKPTDGGDL